MTWIGYGLPHQDQFFRALMCGGIELQRDDDYLRELLREFEASDEWAHQSVLSSSSDAEDYKRHYHVLLLVDGGMLAPIAVGGTAFRITMSGHDFLALTRRSEAWEFTKTAAKKMGGASVQMLLRIAEGYACEALAKMGIDLR